MKQSEFKRRYDIDMGRYVKKHIYGKGITDVFKMIGKSCLERRQKKLLKQRKKLFRLLLLRLVNMLAKKLAINLFSY